jgi:peptide/nickel transport system permease protein
VTEKIRRMSLKRYVLRRVLTAIPLVLIVITINFLIVHAAPGGPAALLVNPQLPPQVKENVIKAYGFDKSLLNQYEDYLVATLQGNFGYSYFYHTSVLSLIESRIPATLLLMGSSLILAVALSIPMGIVSAKRSGSKVDRGLVTLAMVGYSLPAYVLGLLALTVFSLYLNWFPASGIASTTVDWSDIPSLASHLFLPMMTLTVATIANFSLFVRGSLLDVLRQDYIILARGKGLSESTVLYKHALRNALLPVVTNIGLSIGFILTGAVVTETVFSWPGLGLLTYSAIIQRDYPVVLSLFFIFSVMVIVVNLVTDIVYAFLDPRIAYD